MPSTTEKWQGLFNDWTEITKSVKEVISVLPDFEEDREKAAMVFGPGRPDRAAEEPLPGAAGRVENAAPTFFEKDLTARYGAIKSCAERSARDAESAWLMTGSYRDDAKTRPCRT
jgi:hypothetical protein